MWPLLVGTAFAGLHADLRAAAEAGAPVVTACSSVQEASDRLRRLAGAMGKEREDLVDRAFGSLFGSPPDGGDSAVADGPFRLAGWLDPEAYEVAFPSTVGAEELARRAAHAREGVATQEGTRWRVHAESGDDQLFSAVPGGVVVATDHPTAAVTEPVPAVIEALPEAPGCGIVVTVPLGELGTGVLGFHLPFAPKTPTSFAVGLPNFPDLAGIAPTPATPAPATSRREPDGVMILGLGLDGINFSRFLDGKELRTVRRIQRALPVVAGTTLAGFGMGDSPDVGAVIPLGRTLPARTVARRLRALGKQAGADFTTLDKTHSLLTVGVATIHVAAQPGRILLATEPGLLAEIEAGGGAPWVHGRAAEMAQRFPIVTVSNALPPELGGTRLTEPASFGLDARNGLLVGEAYIPLTLEEFAQLVNRNAEAREKRKQRTPPPGDGT